jgi:carbon storage regulator CsrA
MLVLSRKLNEEIVFPGLDIKVTIVGVGTGRVQVGIEAPREIQITRPEIQQSSRPVPLSRHRCLVGATPGSV